VIKNIIDELKILKILTEEQVHSESLLERIIKKVKNIQAVALSELSWGFRIIFKRKKRSARHQHIAGSEVNEKLRFSLCVSPTEYTYLIYFLGTLSHARPDVRGKKHPRRFQACQALGAVVFSPYSNQISPTEPRCYLVLYY
jgi:hypothetical protein